MKYLVLRQFISYGRLLIKGTVVDESEIRSPHLRMAEGKIVPAVSSSTVPAEPGDLPDPPGAQEDVNKPVEPAKPKLSFGQSALKYTNHTRV